jgi:L-ornithine Nalpha-acyltransferase
MPCREEAKAVPSANDQPAVVERGAGGRSALASLDLPLGAGGLSTRSSGVIGAIGYAAGSLPIERLAGCCAAPVVDISSGPLRVRLAKTEADIDAAQALRYRVFYENLGARPALETERRRRDSDPFDKACDHLLVLDRSRSSDAEIVVGTYRLIRRDAAARLGQFYSAAEYDIARLVDYPGEILELGRSCVDAAYRQRPTMQLLWSGIAAYVYHYDIALMFGCASLPGTDPEALATPLSYLHHHHLAPPPLRPRAVPDRYLEMCRRGRRAIDPARAFAALPPLIKGYLRLGGFVGDGAVIDREFNTIDVCVVVKTDLVSAKYSRHYVRRAKRVGRAWDGYA